MSFLCMLLNAFTSALRSLYNEGSVSFSRCTMIFKFSFQVYAILISFWVGGIVKVLEKTVVTEKDGPKSQNAVAIST